MDLEAPARRDDAAVEQATELLIKEARRRQRRRWLLMVGVVLLLALAGRLIVAGMAGGPPPPAHHQVHRHVHPPPAPLTPVTAAPFAKFTGKWALENDAVTIQGNGQGSIDWRTLTWCPSGTTSPFDGAPCDTMTPDGVITSGGHADLQLTAASGTTATAVVAGSTEPSVLPDGPAHLRVTGQDQLYVTPSQPTADGPFGRSALCGPTAASLSVAQQQTAGINCGA